jgi:hypothetical protein
MPPPVDAFHIKGGIRHSEVHALGPTQGLYAGQLGTTDRDRAK